MTKPFMTELKKKVNAMGNVEVGQLAENPGELRSLYMNQPEVIKIKSEVDRLLKDVSDQTNENLQERV
jgi:hypothetical protein